MKVKHQDNKKNGKFYINKNGSQVAEMTYTYSDSEKISIDHTEVDDSLEGQGLGHNLLDAAVAFVRNKNLKIIPLCSFAEAILKKNDKYSDVLA